MNRIRINVAMIAFLATLVAAYGQENATDLADVVLDKSVSIEKRVGNLDKLRRIDNATYLEMLSELVDGDEKPFAIHAADQLVKLVVMIGGHDMAHVGTGDSAPRHDMKLVADVTPILRKNIENQYPEVREVVASYLLSRGDEKALMLVREAVSTGVIPDEEALNYFVAAPTNVSESDLRRYAEKGDENLAKRAIEVLASDTSQQLYVRENLLANVSAQDMRRTLALAGLAKYDASFATYATQPDIVDLALTVDSVPGAEGLSGADLIAKTVRKDIGKNPNLRDFYTRRLMEASEALRGDSGSWKSLAIENSIIQQIK